jgi:hypothetical protein
MNDSDVVELWYAFASDPDYRYNVKNSSYAKELAEEKKVRENAVLKFQLMRNIWYSPFDNSFTKIKKKKRSRAGYGELELANGGWVTLGRKVPPAWMGNK